MKQDCQQSMGKVFANNVKMITHKLQEGGLRYCATPNPIIYLYYVNILPMYQRDIVNKPSIKTKSPTCFV